jgi:hypothetical protein
LAATVAFFEIIQVSAVVVFVSKSQAANPLSLNVMPRKNEVNKQKIKKDGHFRRYPKVTSSIFKFSLQNSID